MNLSINSTLSPPSSYRLVKLLRQVRKSVSEEARAALEQGYFPNSVSDSVSE